MLRELWETIRKLFEVQTVATHHDKLPALASLDEGLYGARLVVAHVRNGLIDGMPVDLGCAIHGGVTALSAAASFYPHDHASFVMSEEGGNQSTEELATRLESALPPEGQSFGDAGAFPWALIVPLILEIIRRLMEK
jgi:hypothetical protein